LAYIYHHRCVLERRIDVLNGGISQPQRRSSDLSRTSHGITGLDSSLVRRAHDTDDVNQEIFLRAHQTEQNKSYRIEMPSSFLSSRRVSRPNHGLHGGDIRQCHTPREGDTLEDEMMASLLIGIHCKAVFT
jgi:hypothetical protein